jgi:hypothetical protein
MKNLLLILLGFLLVGCASETEQKSMDEVASIYDAKTAYSKGIKRTVGTPTEKTFTITVSESKLIDSLNPNVSSANIGMLVYKALTEEEKRKYTHINVNMLNLKKDSAKYRYTTASFARLIPKFKTFSAVSTALVDKEYKALNDLKDAKEIPNDVSEFAEKKIAFLEQEYGKLKRFYSFGIGEASDEIGTIYQFQGFMEFQNKRIPYIVVTDADPENDKMIGFNIFN